MNRRKFLKGLVLTVGSSFLPFSILKANVLNKTKLKQEKTITFNNIVQLYEDFETLDLTSYSDKNNRLERYIKPAVAQLQQDYLKYKRKGYISFIPPHAELGIKVTTFKHNGVYFRFIQDAYSIETDTFMNRIDMFLGKV